MAKDIDLLDQITNAVLDIQASDYQSFERPLKTLARLLHHPDLEAINRDLTEGVNFDAFMASSAGTRGGMAGSSRLAWPDDDHQVLGLTLMLIDKLADNPDYAIGFCHQFFYSGSKIIAGIHSFTRQVLIPFARDYRAYVSSYGNVRPRLIVPSSNKVFIVHGHDEAALQGLARFLEKLGLEAIVLKEQPDQGRTIIEKFEASASDVGYAVVLLTPDDVGSARSDLQQNIRARQNTLFELGYFAAKLGRGRVCLLRKGDVEIPSDLFGIVYTTLDASDGWKMNLMRELKAAGLEFDSNRMWGT
jgi:hypothetical protein